MGDLIAAAATAAGKSAVGIIRISGDGAIEAAQRVFLPDSGRGLAEMEPRKLVLGMLLDKNGHTVDRCLAFICRAPNSYTGEDTAEIQCHGSPVVIAEGLSALFAAGARMARPGEFTKRAFLNGRMELSAAEAVADLISAETAAAALNAAGQLGGAVARKTDAIYDSLAGVCAHFHAVIDYPDEDIDEFQLRDYLAVFDRGITELARLGDSFERGRILKDGALCAIIGRPNAGKSTLLNALLGFERAIVTDVPGTTRDTIEEKCVLGGVLMRLTDTAGLRETMDPVERIGVERSYRAAEGAELVIAVFDGAEALTEEDEATVGAARGKRSVAVVNKSDLPLAIDLERIEGLFEKVCVLSALDGAGLEELDAAVSGMFRETALRPDGEIITNARQAQAIGRALSCLESARDAAASGVTPDAVLTEVEAAMAALGEVTGRSVREDVTAQIFQRFCVGK